MSYERRCDSCQSGRHRGGGLGEGSHDRGSLRAIQVPYQGVPAAVWSDSIDLQYPYLTVVW